VVLVLVPVGAGVPGPAQEEARRHHRVAAAVMNMVCDYDPGRCGALERFEPVVRGSRCLFARSAQLWGSREYDSARTVEANVQASAPTLLQFLLRGEEERLDGFLFEIRNVAATDIHEVGEAVRRVLACLAQLDPAGEDCMGKSYIHTSAWHFTFAKVPIFITTFAPCYPRNHCRFSYGSPKDSVFVLLQPEYSFLHHGLVHDRPTTNWEKPQDMRDRIRVSFRQAGQEYVIPPSVSYPVVEHIVKPLGHCSTARPLPWFRHRPKSCGHAIASKDSIVPEEAASAMALEGGESQRNPPGDTLDPGVGETRNQGA